MLFPLLTVQPVRRVFFAICEETVDSDSNAVVKYVYTLGASGERIKVEESDRTVEYTYDELYRLTSETITEGENVTVYTYAYDSVGNRVSKTKNDVETVYTYNELNQLVSENDITYEYDLNFTGLRSFVPVSAGSSYGCGSRSAYVDPV